MNAKIEKLTVKLCEREIELTLEEAKNLQEALNNALNNPGAHRVIFIDRYVTPTPVYIAPNPVFVSPVPSVWPPIHIGTPWCGLGDSTRQTVGCLSLAVN
jgi:hypothetical protein